LSLAGTVTVSIEPGDTVRLAYIGRFDDGSVFATSDPALAEEHGLLADGTEGASDPSPISFTVGAGEVIAGLDESVVGMTAGEEATVTVPPEDGYGEYDPERVREYDIEAFEQMVGKPPEIGLHVEAKNDLHGDVTAISDGTVEVDFNHELAGKTLVFDIEVLTVT
jgi:FKBP-type peptidyl-prolyl cis-trans isomerase 2